MTTTHSLMTPPKKKEKSVFPLAVKELLSLFLRSRASYPLDIKLS